MQDLVQFRVPLFTRPVGLADEFIYIPRKKSAREVVLRLMELNPEEVGQFEEDSLKALEQAANFVFIDEALAELVYVALKTGKLEGKIPDHINEIVVLGSFISSRALGGCGVSVIYRHKNGPWIKTTTKQEDVVRHIKMFYALAE